MEKILDKMNQLHSELFLKSPYMKLLSFLNAFLIYELWAYNRPISLMNLTSICLFLEILANI